MSTNNNNAPESTEAEVAEITFATPDDYRQADVKGKAAIRKAVQNEIDRAQTAMSAAVKALDFEAASVAQAELESLEAVLSGYRAVNGAAKVEVDPYAVLAHRIATLETAAAWLREGSVLPEGLTVEGDFDSERLETAIEAVEDDIESVAKVAGQKLTRSGTRSDIAAAIVEAFADLEKGDFLTCQEITNKMGLPSSGAVSARLFPAKGKCTVKGIVPVAATADHAKGATKA